MNGALKCFDDEPKKLCLRSFRVFAGQHDLYKFAQEGMMYYYVQYMRKSIYAPENPNGPGTVF